MPKVVFTSTISRDGSIVIPKEALERLGVTTGAKVEAFVELTNPAEFATPPILLGEVLKDLLAEIETLEPETKAVYNDPCEKAYGEALQDKYRKMGLRV